MPLVKAWCRVCRYKISRMMQHCCFSKQIPKPRTQVFPVSRKLPIESHNQCSPGNDISDFYFTIYNMVAPGAEATVAHQGFTCTFYFWHSCIWGEPMWLRSVQLHMGGNWCMPSSDTIFKSIQSISSSFSLSAMTLHVSDDWLQNGNSLGSWVNTWRRVVQPLSGRQTPLWVKLLKVWGAFASLS